MKTLVLTLALLGCQDTSGPDYPIVPGYDQMGTGTDPRPDAGFVYHDAPPPMLDAYVAPDAPPDGPTPRSCANGDRYLTHGQATDAGLGPIVHEDLTFSLGCGSYPAPASACLIELEDPDTHAVTPVTWDVHCLNNFKSFDTNHLLLVHKITCVEFQVTCS